MKTTIYIDANNLAIRCAFSQDVYQVGLNDDYYIDWEHWSYLVFSNIYKALNHVTNCNEIILAVDAKVSWRKDVWSRYKESRSNKRATGKPFDWPLFFEKYAELQEEFKKHFPFKILAIDKCEADDIIGVLVLNNPEKSQIISSDKDFIQLYIPDRVSIYSPMTRTNLLHPNTEMFLVEQSLIGQSKDDIFNIITPLDHPIGKRKPGYGEKALDKTIAYGWKRWLKDKKLEERYEFNRNLMDFRRIPEPIKENIITAREKYETPHPENIYKFFKEHHWPEYLENLTNVENRLYELY
jgi:hypothetical protein